MASPVEPKPDEKVAATEPAVTEKALAIETEVAELAAEELRLRLGLPSWQPKEEAERVTAEDANAKRLMLQKK